MPDNPVEVQYEPGYRLGYEKDGKSYFNNHLKFVMKYHLDPAGTYRVVGFLIETQSIDKAGLEITGATALHCTALYCTALQCTALHCTQGTRARCRARARRRSTRRARPACTSHTRSR
jgi:hypothetical protein